MKICLVGKYPPIQGGVSARTYSYAHALARKGHQVHVVTNAKEVQPPYRMLMRDEDWARCDADYGEGYVRVHWTEAKKAHWHIPMGDAFVTKLASVGAEVCEEFDIEVVFSYYWQPYAVAGHMIAEMASLPHVIRNAGSDAGRLWLQEQFSTLFTHILKKADYLLAGGKVARKLEKLGIDPIRLRPDPEFTISEDLFSPNGPALDVEAVCEAAEADPEYRSLQWGTYRPDFRYIGIYGKLGEKKGTPALLEALARLVKINPKLGLLVLGQGHPKADVSFAEAATALGLEDHIVQLPFLPNWRVPEFIRRCEAVCALEQDFPIVFHAPVVAREVLCCGGMLVGSTEMLGKLPNPERLAHGYNCFGVNDVNDIDELSRAIETALSAAQTRPEIGLRGREAVIESQKTMRYPERTEQTLALAISKDRSGGRRHQNATPSLKDLAANAGNIGSALRQDVVRLDLCLEKARAEAAGTTDTGEATEALFRMADDAWMDFPNNMDDLVPVPLSRYAVERFEHDINQLLPCVSGAPIPANVTRKQTWAIFVPDLAGTGVRTIVIDAATAALLDVIDGQISVRSVTQIIRAGHSNKMVSETRIKQSIEQFFRAGVIGLESPKNVYASAI
ncbi:MAG: glycosyltransferase [Alphaproteobacteria bacterium]|nr:glycosyltransferase [Alphaproteobacteria bacterium]